MYMHIYVHTYIHIYKYVYTRIHFYIYVYIYRYMYICIYISISIYAYTLTTTLPISRCVCAFLPSFYILLVSIIAVLLRCVAECCSVLQRVAACCGGSTTRALFPSVFWQWCCSVVAVLLQCCCSVVAVCATHTVVHSFSRFYFWRTYTHGVLIPRETLQHAATQCNTLPHTWVVIPTRHMRSCTSRFTATHCNTMHHTSTHCNMHE